MLIAQTSRLILRRFEEDDFEDLYEYLSDPEVVKFEPYKAMNAEETAVNLKWRIADNEMIAVALKDTSDCTGGTSRGKLIGNIYLGQRDFETYELGFVFSRAFQGQGYAYEAATAMMSVAFTSGAHRIVAECDPLNISSVRLLERLGMRREGELKQNVFFERDENDLPIWKDTYIYAILDSEFALTSTPASKETLFT